MVEEGRGGGTAGGETGEETHTHTHSLSLSLSLFSLSLALLKGASEEATSGPAHSLSGEAPSEPSEAAVEPHHSRGRVQETPLSGDVFFRDSVSRRRYYVRSRGLDVLDHVEDRVLDGLGSVETAGVGIAVGVLEGSDEAEERLEGRKGGREEGRKGGGGNGGLGETR